MKANKVLKGVGVIITNKKRNKFYFQQKDETYWIKQYRLKYSFFGGGVEQKEGAHEALKRELYEELESVAAKIVLNNYKEVFISRLVNIFGKNCKHFIFEAILSDEELKKINELPIKEGKQGKIFSRQELVEDDFFIGGWKILENYFKLRENISA